ncbi:PEP-CTERM sorting domain-containing protein [Methylomonas koyamae]|nr:PEP-CTERM sorting domain-containing protein [Methylomonas koyamae]
MESGFNPNGMPEGFHTEASARMSESIQIGAANIASLQIKFDLSGKLLRSGGDGWEQYSYWDEGWQTSWSGSAMRALEANGFGQWVFNSFGTVNVPLWDNTNIEHHKSYFSALIPVVNGSASFEISLLSATEANFFYTGAEGGIYDITADSTLSLLGIYAYDSNGNLLNSSLLSAGINELKGQSGASYSLLAAPVPDPESYVLMLSGLGFLGSMMRRRQSIAA